MRIKRFRYKIKKKYILEIIKEKQKPIYSEKDFYKPIIISIYGSNYCNISCFACGASAENNKHKSVQFSIETICSLIEQAIDLGFIAYTLTVPAEPFLDLSYQKVILEKYGDKIDCVKLNTNGSMFTSLEKARYYMKYLKVIGWTNTKYFIPSLTLSLGMQQKEVPICNLVWAIIAFQELFNKNEATLCISHYYSSSDQFATFLDLKNEYMKVTGVELENDILFKTNQLLKEGRAKGIAESHFTNYNIKHKLSSRKCFKLIIDEYIEPALHIIDTGDASNCPGFNREKTRLIGNIFHGSIKSIIQNVNHSEFYKIVSQKGTKGVSDLIYNKNFLDNTSVTNRHEACYRLQKLFEEKIQKNLK